MMTKKVKWNKGKEIKIVGGQLSLNKEKCFIRYHTLRHYETCYNVSTDDFNKTCYINCMLMLVERICILVFVVTK